MRRMSIIHTAVCLCMLFLTLQSGELKAQETHMKNTTLRSIRLSLWYQGTLKPVQKEVGQKSISKANSEFTVPEELSRVLHKVSDRPSL